MVRTKEALTTRLVLATPSDSPPRRDFCRFSSKVIGNLLGRFLEDSTYATVLYCTGNNNMCMKVQTFRFDGDESTVSYLIIIGLVSSGCLMVSVACL